jgi:hypothetical protein
MRQRLASRHHLHREPRRAHGREPIGEHAVAAADDQAVEPARDPRERSGLEQLVVGALRTARCESVTVDTSRQQPTGRIELRPTELHHEPRVARDEDEVARAKPGPVEVLVERAADTGPPCPRVTQEVLQVDEVQAAARGGEVDRR